MRQIFVGIPSVDGVDPILITTFKNVYIYLQIYSSVLKHRIKCVMKLCQLPGLFLGSKKHIFELKTSIFMKPTDFYGFHWVDVLTVGFKCFNSSTGEIACVAGSRGRSTLDPNRSAWEAPVGRVGRACHVSHKHTSKK